MKSSASWAKNDHFSYRCMLAHLSSPRSCYYFYILSQYFSNYCFTDLITSAIQFTRFPSVSGFVQCAANITIVIASSYLALTWTHSWLTINIFYWTFPYPVMYIICQGFRACIGQQCTQYITQPADPSMLPVVHYCIILVKLTATAPTPESVTVTGW